MKKGMFIFLSCLFISCGKSSTTPITQSFISFYANGINEVINGPFGYTNPAGVEFAYQPSANDTFIFGIDAGTTPTIQIYTYLVPILNVKINLSQKLSYYTDTGSIHNFYTFDTTRSYIIFTEIDNVKISGTFACQGANNIGKSVSITQGKFTVFR